VIHIRNSPHVDVSLCGARDTQLKWALTRGRATCPECREKSHSAPVRAANERNWRGMLRAPKVVGPSW
jgi:hypothetical protein